MGRSSVVNSSPLKSAEVRAESIKWTVNWRHRAYPAVSSPSQVCLVCPGKARRPSSLQFGSYFNTDNHEAFWMVGGGMEGVLLQQFGAASESGYVSNMKLFFHHTLFLYVKSGGGSAAIIKGAWKKRGRDVRSN